MKPMKHALHEWAGWIRKNKALNLCAMVACGQSVALAAEQIHTPAFWPFLLLGGGCFAAIVGKLTHDLHAARREAR